MKKLIFLLLPLIAGCNDRLDQYRLLQKQYPNAQIQEIKDFSGQFLILETNNVARVVFFMCSGADEPRISAEIPTAIEAP